MVLGLRTAIYPAPDLAAAKRWYTDMLGVAPYFDEPFYVGFSVGGFELGLLPNADRKSTRLNSSHSQISYAVFCLKKKKTKNIQTISTFVNATDKKLLRFSIVTMYAYYCCPDPISISIMMKIWISILTFDSAQVSS